MDLSIQHKTSEEGGQTASQYLSQNLTKNQTISAREMKENPQVIL